MKQNVILWVCTGIILFVASYYKTVTSQYYPVSGSFGIEREIITFKFDKIFRGDGAFPVIIRTDKKGISGYLSWRKENETTWNRSDLLQGNGALKSSIPGQFPFTILYYKAVLFYKENSFTIPRNRPVKLEFRNKISPSADSLFYFFLFGGIFLSIRTGLEIFRNNDKVKALSIFTLIFFVLLAFAFSPLRNSYDAGFLKGTLPKPGEIFLMRDIMYFLIWLAGNIGLFIFKKWKYSILLSSILVLILFLVLGYPR